MTKKVLLKDILFNKAKVEHIAGEIHRVHRSFPKDRFIRDVVTRFPELELKARIAWIAECLKKYLPSDYTRAVSILINALPLPNNPALSDDDFGDFIYAPYAEYVAQNGCTKEYLRCSLNALYAMTQRFSAEDAIRSFINAFPDVTLKVLKEWTQDGHYHVRRLCSEGTRPKLPWSRKIHIPVSASLPILDRLFFDTTRFVTRSVANHINDISKIDSDVVFDTLSKWKASGRQKPAEMDYIIRHALRTLIKQGHPKAIRMLGFRPAPRVSVSQLIVPQVVTMNTALEFSFIIQSEENTSVLIDYILSFQNKTATRNSKKVFKLTQRTLVRDQPVIVSKRHKLRANMTTRTLYPGKHTIEIQINGKVYASATFMLLQ